MRFTLIISIIILILQLSINKILYLIITYFCARYKYALQINNMRLYKILVIAILVFTANTIKAQDINTKLDSLDKYFEQSIKDWKVPGLAVGIIKGDSLIFSKGYGYRNIKKEKEVNSQTIFPVASNTKAFTSAAIAILVDQGKISWDTKVSSILPYFHLYDKYVTDHFTIEDLLSHRSGLKTFSGDLLWYGTNYKRQEVIQKAHLLKPKYEFRTHFGYSNIMYITAGNLIAKVSGMTYDEFIKKHFFENLGMKNSYTSIEDLKNLKNVCTPYNYINDETIEIDLMNWDNIGGAGVINSNIDDMSKWIMLQLNKGTYNNKEVFSSKQSTKMLTPFTNFAVSEGYNKMFPSTHFRSYGLGWSLMDYHGFKVASHSGGYDGVITYTCFVPGANVGFVILTNSTSSLYNALSYKILDALLSNDNKDWSKLFLPYQLESYVKKDIPAKENPKAPSLDLKEYAGLYHSELYGNVLVKKKGKKLFVNMVRTNVFEGNAIAYDGDVFMLEFKQVPSLPQGTISFTIENNKAKSLIIDIPNPDFDFTEFTFEKIDWITIPEEKEEESK